MPIVQRDAEKFSASPKNVMGKSGKYITIVYIFSYFSIRICMFGGVKLSILGNIGFKYGLV